MKVYVAVVTKAWQLSGRPEGDWGSFINKNKKDAIAAALKARAKWEAKGFGPYQIWVGVLTQEVQTPVKFELAAITERKRPLGSKGLLSAYAPSIARDLESKRFSLWINGQD